MPAFVLYYCERCTLCNYYYYFDSKPKQNNHVLFVLFKHKRERLCRDTTTAGL